jgi:hypothetical protein
MRQGRIVELAPTPQIFSAPQHAYTRLLLSAISSPDPDVPMNFGIGEELARPQDERRKGGGGARPRDPAYPGVVVSGCLEIVPPTGLP